MKLETEFKIVVCVAIGALSLLTGLGTGLGIGHMVKSVDQKDFSSVSALSTWAEDHVQSYTPYAEASYTAALKVQKAGLKDGYLMSTNIQSYWNDSTESYIYTIYNTAFVMGQQYYWNPEDGTIYQDLSTWRE
jgi:hypothetical protein